MPKTLTLRVDDETYETLAKKANLENRSIANFIENAVKERIREEEFMDDYEMESILADKQLVQRLKKGSIDASRKKGKMIG